MSIETTDGPHLSREPPLVKRIRACLDGRRGLDLDLEVVRQAVGELDYDTARYFNYGYFELNLLSIFGDRFSSQSIRELALRSVQQRLVAVWDAVRRGVPAGDGPDGPILRGWNPAALRQMLARGRGVILATAHIGPFRFITSDLATLGFDVCMALDDLSSRTCAKTAARWNAARDAMADRGLGACGTLSVCNVEQTLSGTPALMKALRRGQIVLFFVDGNVGADGSQGASNRCAVRFLGRDTLVKTGVAQLAIATDASLVTAFARRTDEGEVVDVGPCATFPTRNGRDDRSHLAREWTETFYATLEREFLRRPAEWEGVKTFHRWRATGNNREERPGAESRAATPGDVEMALTRGAVFHTKRGRVSMFNRRPPVLCDVEKLHGYQFGDEWYDLIYRLHHGPGVDHDSVVSDAAAHHKAGAIDLLASLERLGLLDVTWHGHGQ